MWSFRISIFVSLQKETTQQHVPARIHQQRPVYLHQLLREPVVGHTSLQESEQPSLRSRGQRLLAG